MRLILIISLTLLSNKIFSAEPSNSIKNKIINEIEEYEVVSRAAFGNDVVGGDSAYDIFWIWMPKVNKQDYDSIAEFFCPILKKNGLSKKTISIKKNNSYETLGRAYCR
tara:strand:- start:520 stop:846 length:327 start_codon:yes stop_codon:yes gene_type:complete